MHRLILLLSFLILSSCGKSNSNAGMPRDFNPQGPAPVNEVTPRKKFFLTNLVSINPEVTGNISGRLTVEQTGFSFKSKLSISTAAWHQDSIYIGSRCPTKADDVNGDLVIDINEAKGVVGDEIITLSRSSRITHFSGNFDLDGKVLLINSSTESMACGVIRVVSSLPTDTDYEPVPRPNPRPTPEPNPTPTPEPDTDDDSDDEEDEDSWTDRWNDWWRCRLGGCD